jgi:hypothetical protein
MYVREWIEFHLLMGFSHFIFYDNYSEDGLKELLQPYIQESVVTHILWTPEKVPNEIWNDPLLERHYRAQLQKCYNNDAIRHRQLACQKSAFDDAIRITRGKTRWLAAIDVDEYFYLPSSTHFNDSSTKPLVQAFKTLEDHELVIINGQHFGTSGWLSPPRRDDDQTHSQLIIKTHTRHMRYQEEELVSVKEHQKTFVSPYCVYGNEIHYYLYDSLLLPTFSTREISHDENFIYHNHYNWPSMIENIEKAIENKNPATTYNMEYDLLLNKVEDLNINYLIEALEKRMQKSMKTHPPSDTHNDDWDFTLFQKHTLQSFSKTDVLVVVLSPRHIGLTRHALKSIYNYFYKVEPKLNYKVAVVDGLESILKEIRNDFPIDLVTNDFKVYSISAEMILILKEDSFARWELWPEDLPVIQMASKLFQADTSINTIYLGDSSNLMSEWTKIEQDKNNIIYRMNPGLSKLSGSYLIKNQFIEDLKLYEICLDRAKYCYGNEKRGLFQQYHQERMYGYSPGFMNLNISQPEY